MADKFVFLDNPSSLAPVATPRVLTVAGSDPSGGAGIEADLKTITSYGCHGLTCVDVLTVQNTLGVSGKMETAATVVQDILQADFADGGIHCVKIGVVTRPGLTAIVPLLETFRPQLVVDTVISSTSGFTMAKQTLVRDCIAQLYRYATVITPNWDEAKIIYGLLFPDGSVGEPSIAGCEDLARKLASAIGCRAVLIKGGHVPAQEAVTDVLYDRLRDEARARVRPGSAHGRRKRHCVCPRRDQARRLDDRRGQRSAKSRL
ncbi:hypothetical protein KL930_004446 [Ogataea haglerorum]|uniref:Pyridoxamine kinase/Phosphomethylpyrimidine kinase domain-containing protein n=1 Tax=Ogataea haglerorum TaxID=1937702 RepID=A0AAN6D3Z1_9ASCO|nr:hypothetical protein KL950_004745 [Ogataea haglerorum]KAG7725298.1 hypothetical protein KL933_004312 [Ogataea haglerorum]KAG7735526.1 hypothetical protein KL932_004474 [Ogataea haglerorum]KAG7754948.1 hypothetical protein KL947_004726 [Ogataea haglerorum]KAG7773331.1 hypothetical protein KL930_004446 [Ogataea haglerorum]